MKLDINIEDIELVKDVAGSTYYYVFWRDIFVGTIEQQKKSEYMPPELVGMWECGYTSNDYHETKELAAVNSTRKYLKRNPDRVNGPTQSDLENTKKFKLGLQALKQIRIGDYGPENNIIKQEFKQWCIKNKIEDEKFKSKVVEDYMLFFIHANTWPITKDNQEYGKYIHKVMCDFLKYIILHGVSIRTFRKHSNNLSILGPDVLEKQQNVDFTSSEFKDIFFQDIQVSSQNPPDYGYIDVEGYQKRYFSTCKKLTQYLIR